VRTRPPEISDADVAALLQRSWGLAATSVEYRPVGFGSHHWAVVTDGARWFLTIDDLDTKRRTRDEPRAAVQDRLRAALAAARDLADTGLTFVVAPLPASDGDVVVPLDDRFTAALYPHVDGAARAWGDALSSSDRLAVLDLAIGVHGATSRHARVEDLAVPKLDDLHTALADIGRPWTGGPFAEPARRLLAEHRTGLRRMLEHHRRLARSVLADRDRFVLTHGEPHPGNTMLTEDGLVLVDWDTALVAPPERDLWMIAGDDHTVPRAYTSATGRRVDGDAITCYRLGWDIADIAIYVSLLHDEHTSTDDVTESWRQLQHLLRPTERWPQLLG